MASMKECRMMLCWIGCSKSFGVDKVVAMEAEVVVVESAEA